MKPNKQASVDRKKKINQQNEVRTNRPAKGQDSNKVHNHQGQEQALEDVLDARTRAGRGEHSRPAASARCARRPRT